MRWLLATTVLVWAAAPGFAQQNDAEKLYREFEKKLTSTKAFKVTFEFDADQGAGKLKIKGELTVAAGNKIKLSFDGSDGTNQMTGTLVSDGKQLAMKIERGGQGDTKNEDLPDQLSARISAFMARGGIFFAMETALKQQALDNVTTADFKLGVKEKVGDKEAQVVEYIMTVPDQVKKTPLTVKVWFDVKTKMPLKRTLEMDKGGGVPSVVVELYTNWQIDAKVRDGDFMLPPPKQSVALPEPRDTFNAVE